MVSFSYTPILSFFLLVLSCTVQGEVGGKDPLITSCGFDIAFVLDRSQSVTEVNFPKIKEFVKQVIESLTTQLNRGVGPAGIQFALIPFNSDAEVLLYLDESTSLPQVLSAVDNLFYSPGLTNPHDALEKVMSEVFTTGRGDRADTTNALIFVSDGARTIGTNDPTQLAEQFRSSQNGQILAVGVEGLNGPHQGVFYNELIGMAGTSHNVFNVTSYDGLFNVFRDVSTSLNC